MKITKIMIGILTEDGRTVALEYGAECDLDFHITQRQEVLRGFHSFNPGEAAELCPTGETVVELKLKATNRELVQKAAEFSATRFDVQILEHPR